MSANFHHRDSSANRGAGLPRPGRPGWAIKSGARSGLKCLGPLLALVLVIGLSGCGSFGNRSGKSYVINGQRYHILASAKGFEEKGLASWYGEPFHGRLTANGEIYDMNKISAAHKTLPLGTWVEVKNLSNKKTLITRINDRGPFVRGRVIDLSREAARQIGMLKAGVAPVKVRAIDEQKARKMTAEAEKQADPVRAAGFDWPLELIAEAEKEIAAAAGR